MQATSSADVPQTPGVGLFTLGLAAVAGAVALESFLSPAGAPILTAVAALVATTGVLIRRHLASALLVTLLLSLGLMHELSSPALTAPVRIYWADLALGALLIAGALRTLEVGRIPRLGRHLLLVVGFSALWTLLGILRGQSALDAIGVFRRIALYPTIFWVAAVAIHRQPDISQRLINVLLAAATIVCLHTAYRLATGVGYAETYFAGNDITHGGVSRWTSYVEVLAPVVAFWLLIHRTVEARGARRKLAYLTWAALFLFPVVASNYRSAWGAFLLGAVVWAISTRRKLSTLARWAGALSVFLLVIGTGVYFVADPAGLPTHKFSAENIRLTTGWRASSWKAAARVFADNPLTGVGLGYRHRFTYYRGGVGVDASNTTIHNDVLWILVDTGILGALIILGFHLRWLRIVWRGLREGRGRRDLLSAIVAGYVTICIIALFQPMFFMPTLVLATSALMGISMALTEADRAP